jgi:hypothetical protein
MNNLETLFFPVTPAGEGFFRLFYNDGRVGKVVSKLNLDERVVQFLVKDLFFNIPEVHCIEVSSPGLGYTALFPRR